MYYYDDKMTNGGENDYRLKIGLDVGSTTAKMVVLDRDGRILSSYYERHNARVCELLSKFINSLKDDFGDVPVIITVTGSVGMAVAERLHCIFVQEVVAASEYARRIHPEAKALIDIGGEDAKVVFFNGRNTDLRMNGNCAGGTGAFIDQMALLMGVSNSEMNALALKAERTHPIAARCGVFSKTDVQNLMARNIPAEEIAASIFHAIAVQTVTSLSHGHQFEAPILLCGGPLTFLPALRKAFADYLSMREESFVTAENFNLVPAMGCAMRSDEHHQKGRLLSEIQQILIQPSEVRFSSTLQPLFTSISEYDEWKHGKSVSALPVASFIGGKQQIVLGIDSGSTTTKIIAADVCGRILFRYYAQNLGNPISAAQCGLLRLQEEARQNSTQLEVIGSCSTGYGEDLIKAAFNLNDGIIETMAHYCAASALIPDVSFILDIGGQDMKAIFVEDGVVVRMDLNEACSSGCGTFISTFASSLGYSVEDFARNACLASSPCDLGTRCTVFMNSRVKQMLREGATIADISAGLAYSVVKNCLFKVLKFKQSDELGSRVVVQGGTMRNDSVVRAFENLTGTSVVRSDAPELMGAYGCALHAANNPAQRYTTVEDMLSTAVFDTHHLQCHGCENNCFVSRYEFSSGNRFFSGNKCEKVFSNKGGSYARGENIYVEKNRLLFDRPMVKEPTPLTFGIPRVLNMYEDYPFWNALLNACGFNVMLSQQSTFAKYESALNYVMADNICFPAKLVHSHIVDLCGKGVDRILMPYVVYEHKDDSRVHNTYNCPIVSGYSDVVRSSQAPSIPFDSPVITFADEELLKRQLYEYLSQFGVDKRLFGKAFALALQEQERYRSDIQHAAQMIYEKSHHEGRMTILLAGKPYHADFLVQHKLSEMISSLGVNVISDDIVRGNETVDVTGTHLVRQWAYMNCTVKAAQWVADHGDDVHFVQITSFGCGPDAFILDEVRDILRRAGKPFTLLKVDDVNNIGSLNLRVRSLVESMRNKTKKDETVHRKLLSTRPFSASDARKKFIVPYISEYVTPMLTAVFKVAGYDLDVLPPSDEKSADLGLKYANNEVCYPATLIVGDIIKALLSGKYDPANTVVGMIQTGGQCRETNYLGLIKRAMVAAGFKNVPVVACGTKGITFNPQNDFHIDWIRLAPSIVNSLFFIDTLSRMYHAAVVREKLKGKAKEIRDSYLMLGKESVEAGHPGRLLKLVASAAREYEDLSDDRQCPKVGVVGEVFLKFNPFAHLFVTRYLIEHGIEVSPPLMSPFFMKTFVNSKVDYQMHLRRVAPKTRLTMSLLYRLIDGRMKKYNAAASHFRHFQPLPDIFDLSRLVDGVVSLACHFGERWLLPADIIAYYNEGIKSVVSLQPFGCIANHIVSKGIEKKLHQLCPDLNLLSLDFDSGVSATNVTNRLILFIDQINHDAKVISRT